MEDHLYAILKNVILQHGKIANQYMIGQYKFKSV